MEILFPIDGYIAFYISSTPNSASPIVVDVVVKHVASGNTKLPNMEDECKLCLIHTVTLQVLNNTSYLLNQCENDVYQLNLMKFE